MAAVGLSQLSCLVSWFTSVQEVMAGKAQQAAHAEGHMFQLTSIVQSNGHE